MLINDTFLLKGKSNNLLKFDFKSEEFLDPNALRLPLDAECMLSKPSPFFWCGNDEVIDKGKKKEGDKGEMGFPDSLQICYRD